MSKRNKPRPETKASTKGIKVWKPVALTEIASSVAKQMREQGVPLPPNSKVVSKTFLNASQVPVEVSLGRWKGLYPERPMEVQARIKMREGKKTWICMGTSPDTCGLAPWNEPGIDEWIALNDAHQLSFMHMDKITRWCQVHQKWRYMRKNPRYDIDHWAWLREKHPFPIYMQRHDPEVPSSVPIPLRSFCERFLAGRYSRGAWYQRVLEAGSTFSYIIPMAIMEMYETRPEGWKIGDPPYGRIEFYGVELAQEVEYTEQRPSTEFWMGVAGQWGIEIHVPEITRVLRAHFYGYDHPQPETKEQAKMLENNVGKWDDYPDGNEEIAKHIITPSGWFKAAEEWHGQFERSARNATG